MTANKFDNVDDYDFLDKVRKSRKNIVSDLLDQKEMDRREKSLLYFNKTNVIEQAELQLSIMNGEYRND